MMKRTLLVFSSFVLMCFLAACGNGNTNDIDSAQNNTQEDVSPNNETGTGNDSKDNEETGNSNDQEEMKTQMDKLDFSEIEVEVSYGHDQEYEAEIEQDKNQPIEAKVEDEINNEFLNGKEAFDSIYSKAEKLTLTKDSSDQETIEQILDAFDLDNEYEKFEIEITFDDGSKLDVEDRKTT
ncbi:YusW family protein [Bacillus sp. SD088]|uniref:YusW family protein n=1 Tax=Bacillus sp. SD088 TaxID=2782012 RepID=UPI001A95DC1B|nr:YusW family protein [Bacillus sp. SD088]MBO0992271.1 hypothetical protein [Bacillus sp. SD088]